MKTSVVLLVIVGFVMVSASPAYRDDEMYKRILQSSFKTWEECMKLTNNCGGRGTCEWFNWRRNPTFACECAPGYRPLVYHIASSPCVKDELDSFKKAVESLLQNNQAADDTDRGEESPELQGDDGDDSGEEGGIDERKMEILRRFLSLLEE